MGVQPAGAREFLVTDEVELTLQAGLVSIRRAKLIEVSYVLRVTVNGSIYVDIPVTLINFLSIDPPPPFLSPGSAPVVGAGTVQMPIAMAKEKSRLPVVDINDTFKQGFEVSVNYGACGQAAEQQNFHTRSASDFSLNMQSGPARASSTTLDLDQLLAAGQARADEARRSGAEQFKSRPVSMSESLASNYGGARSAEGPSTSYSNHQTIEPIKRTRSTPLLRAKSSRDQPYASDAESGMSGDEEERDLHAVEARRRMGRQLSLAVIGQEEEGQRALQDDGPVDHDDPDSEELTPRDEHSAPAFLPESTPHGESIKMMQDTPFVPDVPQLSPTPIPDEICELEEPTSEDDREEHESVLDDIMTDEYEHVLDEDFGQGHHADQSFGSEFDYDDQELGVAHQSPRQAEQEGAEQTIEVMRPEAADLASDAELVTERSRDEQVAQSRSAFGSFAASAVSGQSGGDESEVGMVQQAVRRNVSIKIPSHLEPAVGRRESSASASRSDGVASPAASPRKLSIATGMSRQASQDSPRKLAKHASPIGMRRELSNGPSPLRDAAYRTAPPPSPSPSRVSHMYSEGGASPSSRSRLAYSPGPSPMSKGTSVMRRTDSLQSQPLEERPEDNEVPELSQSLAGDSASSEGEGLESPQLDILTPLVSPQTGNVRSPGRRALPRVPSVRSVGSPQSAGSSSNRASWSPSAALIRSQSIFGNAAKVPLAYPPPRGPRDRPLSIINQDQTAPLSPAESTTSSVNSVLPSVRSKIAQLEHRDQALRQFTNVALAQTTAAPSQRRSYTAALGRMSQYSAYDDDDGHGVDYTTRRQSTTSYRDRQNTYGKGVTPTHLRKDSAASIDSTSTTATTIEDALLSRHASMASRKTYNTLSPRQMLPTVYMGAGSDEESSDGLL